MYTIKRQVSSTNIDSNGLLYPHEAFNFTLDVCAFHMENVKSFNDYCEETGSAAFLKAAQFEILKPAKYAEKLTIQDDIYSIKGIYGLRGVTVKNEEDEVCYRAHYTGVFVNKDSGKPIKMPESISLDPELNGKKIEMALESRKIEIPRVKVSKTHSMQVPASYIDINKHMNSSYYLRLAEDILGNDFEYNRIRIEYKMQVKEGESIRIDLLESERSCVCIFAEQDNIHLATVEFSKISNKSYF